MNKRVFRVLLRLREITFEQFRSEQPDASAELDKTMDELRERDRAAGHEWRAPDPREPIGCHPHVAEMIDRGRLTDIIDLAGLSHHASAVVARFGSADRLDDATLGKLVAERDLADAEASAIGFAASLYALTEDDSELAAAIRSARFDGQEKPPTSTRELATVGVGAWTDFFAAHPARIPAGLTASTAGTAMARRLATLHPNAALIGGLPQVRRGQPLSELRTSALAYPGLRLGAVLDDPQSSTEQKTATVLRRIELVQQVARSLGDTDITRLDFAAESRDLDLLGLAQLDASPEEKRMVVDALKAYQRVATLAQDVDTAHTLLKRGIHSATSVAAVGYQTFSTTAGLDAERARRVWDRARVVLADVSLTFGAILDVVGGSFGDLSPDNTPASTVPYLKKLAGFADLFGEMALCRCEHCQSILGPAAYFVDLMKYVDDNIRKQLANRPNHPLDLRTRRPDLWTLELTCANTNDRIPVLDLVAEILENDIAHRRGYTGSLADRAAIADLVYRQNLAVRVDSFRQPFHLPLARLRSYLRVLDQDRAAIVEGIAGSSLVRAQALLDQSDLGWQTMISADPDLAHLSHVYGISFAGTANSVADVEAGVLARAMGLTRVELADVLAARVVSAGGATVSIVAAKRTGDSVQNDVEWVRGLTADALDRMDRFTRLFRSVPWSIVETDRALTALGATSVDANSTPAMADLVAVGRQTSASIDDLCAFVGPMPTTPTSSSLFDRVFNSPVFASADGALPQPTRHFVHPAFRVTTAVVADPALPRLLAALSLDLDGLAILARELAPHLGQETTTSFDPDATDENDRYFVLSEPNLTLLYRHARLARLLSISVAELFQLLRLLGAARVSSLAGLKALLDVHAWWRSSRVRLDDISVASGQRPRDPSRYPVPGTVAAQVVTSAADEFTFKETVFAISPGTTEQASRDLLAANPSLVEALSAGVWRLKSTADLATAVVTIPPSATVVTSTGSRLVTATEVRDALSPYQAAEVAVRSIGTMIGRTTDQVRALAALAGASPGADGVVRAVRGDGPIDPLRDLIAAIVPLSVALAGVAWDAAAIDFVRQHTSAFGTGSLPNTTPDASHPSVPYFSIEQLRSLTTYAAIATRVPAPDQAPFSASELQTVIAAFDAAVPDFPASGDAVLARVLGVPVGLVVGLRGRVGLPAIALLALERVAHAARLAIDIGVDGETLAAIASTSYADLARAADGLVAAVRARYSDAKTLNAKLGEAEDPIREERRDGLCDHLTRSLSPAVFTSVDDLYRYFLVDVAAGGCATTSRVVAATNSVQLYVHRVLMNLEQDELAPTDPNHVGLVLAPGDPQTAAEWGWRKNYRVWEANRKVFLWPENYIEPDLRDDKTPLFVELEQELLQTDIDDQAVLDAYAKYLKGFEEVSSLLIAGAYHDVQEKGEQVRDVLHLFGVAAGDPPTYYYRTCEDLRASERDPTRAAIWTPWRKVNVQIAGRRVAPVVYRGRLHVFWVDIKTRSHNTVKDGGSEFSGYRHRMKMRFTTLRPDGTWTAPQELALPEDRIWPANSAFGPGRGVISDPLNAGGVPAHDNRAHPEPLDDYTLRGVPWEGVWLQPSPDRLSVYYRNFHFPGTADLFARTLSQDFTYSSQRPQLLAARNDGRLYRGKPGRWFWNLASLANCVIEESRIESAREVWLTNQFTTPLYSQAIATVPSDRFLLAIPGSEEDAILQSGRDVVLVQGSVTDDDNYVARRIGTTLAERVARTLFEEGVDGLLDIRTQLALAEAKMPFTPIGSAIADHGNANKLDFTGPYGVYYRELFFHIPFLIANALNGMGRYAAAQRWYHFIFDPTASEVIDINGVPAEEIPHRLLDRVWRYREFRKLDLARLRDILTDEVAISLYRRDPFNPHAIARRRISAYQKAIVMKYVDNLLDWGDLLFTQFTMETVNEALMIYVMASDVLGPRPDELGDCGEGGVSPRDYAHIAPLLDQSSELLIELENWIRGARDGDAPRRTKGGRYMAEAPAVMHARERAPLALRRVDEPRLEPAGTPDAPSMFGRVMRMVGAMGAPHVAGASSSGETKTADGMFRGLGWTDVRTASWAPAKSNAKIATRDGVGGRTFEPRRPKRDESQPADGHGWSVIRQATPVFCVPANKDLRAYWDRVEDRLFKIRHCMDITGQKRELALFAPEIDPRLLVRMRAAGLTLEDVLGATSGDLPPYRFLFLIDRAKAFAASLSGFGAALLAALEKRDAEELNRVRLEQLANLTRMTTRQRRLDIDVAEETLESLRRQREAAQYRHDFYDGLATENRNGAEIAESVARHTAAVTHGVVSILQFVSGALHLIPEIGSPFAMKYGGKQAGNSISRFAAGANAIASVAEAVAVSSGLEANFARRVEGWKHQKDLSDHDLRSLDKQIRAAEIRVDLATHALSLHEKSLEQIDEMIELNDSRFTNVGLFTWLSSEMQRMYRAAYQNALAVARLAEQAYRFERGDDPSYGLSPNYWDTSHAGLLAGDRLLVDLQTLERRYLETNYRTLEIDQPFALSQLDPRALVALRESGECEFEIPEVFFDLHYPGHYKRRIKAARLTIPCVTGPYVNVSATLALLDSQVRTTPTPGGTTVAVPPSRSVSVATSTAQNDAGVFELSFRDERYMPFEGLGAISKWRLSMPKAFRPFDYQTINDVILSISYTAESDGALRARVESQNATLVGGILHHFSNHDAQRVFSLRQDFSTAFTRLLRSPPGTAVRIEISDRQIPLLFRGRNIQVQRGALAVRTASGAPPTGLQLLVDGAPLSSFVSDPTTGGLPAKALPGAFTANLRGSHTIEVVAAGDLAPTSPQPGDTSAIDADKLVDILVAVDFRLV